MRQILVRGAAALVAILFVVGFLSPGTVVSGKASATDPDITITFRGLMVFDQLPKGGHVQVVRLHSDAEHHKVNIRVIGPDFPQGVDWGRDLPKGAALQFEILANPPLPPTASWGSSSVRPFDIKTLYPSSTTLGDFIKKRGVDEFGPIFTFNAGLFRSEEPPVNMNFASLLDPVGRNEPVPTFVETTVATLDPGQIGYLTGGGLNPFPLAKPPGATKWKIIVSNEPDYGHVCGSHFREYYKGFEYTRTGPVPYTAQYVARPAALTTGPCDLGHDQPMSLAEVVNNKQKVTIIETRPCIPITH